MHLDTIARGQTLTCRHTQRTGKVLAVEPDRIRLQLSTGKRITVIADPEEKEIRWQKPRRSHLSLRAIGAR